MKRIMFFFVIMQTVCVTTKHQLVTIYNTSDLKFEFAHHQGKQMPKLTEKLKKSSQDNRKHVFVDQYKVDDQKGLSIKMSDQQGRMYDLHTDDQASVSIQFARNKINKIAKFPQSCKTGDYCARAVLEDTVDQKPLAATAHGHEDQELLSLRISGTSGNYKLSYEHAP